MAKSNSAAENVLDVLLLFSEARTELTVDEISELIETPRSTTYRYIRLLRDKGLIEKTPAGSFQLGARLLQLAKTAQQQPDLATVALPVMEEIARQTKETVLLTRMIGRNAVCIERVEGPQTVRISFDRGRVQPLHAGASSVILLAYANESEWQQYLSLPLERFTDNTITDLDALQERLHSIRRQGYCVSDSEVDVGARAVAVPILNDRQQMVAALSTAGPAFRMDDDTVARHLELLRTAANTLRRQL